jgi:dTDP-4-dehydrorhamnose reductase
MHRDLPRIVILGDGLLGSEIFRKTNWNVISRSKNGFNIIDFHKFEDYFIDTFEGIIKTPKYDIIINCIANTDTYSKNRDTHWQVNYLSVMNLVDFCNSWNIKLVHVSSDYVYTNSVSNASELDIPIHGNNWYSYTKLLADSYIEARSKNYLLCRCTHKKNPFPHDFAWINQIGNFDYVDIIASLIIQIINKNACGTYNVGTELKTMYDLALRTRDVKPCFFQGDKPSDVSMNIQKLKNKLDEK